MSTELVHWACTSKEGICEYSNWCPPCTHTHKEGTCHPTEHMSNQCFGTMTYDLCTLASVPAHSMQTTLGQEPSPSLCLSNVTTHTSLVLPKSWSKPLDDDQLPFLVVPSQQLINSEYLHHIKWFHWLVLLLILLTRHSQERTPSLCEKVGLSTRPDLHLRTAIREQPNLPHTDGLPGSKGERGDIGLQPASCTSPYVQQHTKTDHRGSRAFLAQVIAYWLVS